MGMNVYKYDVDHGLSYVSLALATPYPMESSSWLLPSFSPTRPQFSLSSVTFYVAWQSPSETDVLSLSHTNRVPTLCNMSSKRPLNAAYCMAPSQ